MATANRKDLAKSIIEACLNMRKDGVNQGTAGNISIRFKDGMLITPSGMPYEIMTPDDIVFVDGDGKPEKDKIPSSEWRFHLSILKDNPTFNAVIHNHAIYSSMVSILNIDYIPAIHYMVGVAGGNKIPCVKYATYGTQAEQILGMLVSSDRIVGAATDYIRWRVYGFFFSFIGAMFRAFFVGTTQTRTLTLNSIVMVAANVIFNYTLIFGKFGFPAMGIAGAAIGSSLAELVSVLFFISYTYRKIDYHKYGLNRIPGIRTKALSQIMHISLWTMIQNFISLSTWFLFFIFIEHLGERPLAISNIIRSVSSIPFMTVMAFASTCSSLVSNQIGAGHSKEVPALINQHIRLCSFFVIPLIGLIALFPSTVLRIYTNIPDLITASIPTLWVLCSTYIVSIPGFIYFQSVSGTGNTRAAFILEIIALALYTIYILIVITGLKADVAICWTAEHLYAICIGIASYLYIRKANWQHKRI